MLPIKDSMNVFFKHVVGVLSAGILLGSGLVAGTPVGFQAPTISPPAVKKSVNGICHAKGSRYYAQTKKFSAYKTLRDCLRSGGRMPK
jgi:hypothetical protein